MPVILAVLIPDPESGDHPSDDEVDMLREGHLLIKYKQTDGNLICHVMGNLDERTSGEFGQAIDQLPAGQKVVFELSAVPYMDLVGLAALIDAVTKVGRGGDAAISRPRPPVRRLLQSMAVEKAPGLAIALTEPWG